MQLYTRPTRVRGVGEKEAPPPQRFVCMCACVCVYLRVWTDRRTVRGPTDGATDGRIDRITFTANETSRIKSNRIKSALAPTLTPRGSDIPVV
uniref:Uncharacterized protein n=1 Tax=Caenorhabditis japonica TaxID=281687 RepID=A0A8R1EH25_CAEJA